MFTEVYLASVVLISGAAFVWNQYEYLRVVRSRTGASFPVVGSGITFYIARPWRLWAGFDELVRVGSAHQADPTIEAARQRFLRRRHLILFGFLGAGVAGMLLLPQTP